ncbi:MAG: hypothetical protein JXN61_04605 [Sedimentisphaerales bacterium]|nr:hypothetical protein [Sedimentisphaerales bacterium]
MKTIETITSNSYTNVELSFASLVIAAGGAGKSSALAVKKQHQAACSPFPLKVIAIDTDKTGFNEFDFAIDIAQTQETVSAMVANPQKYGRACRAIVENHPQLLDFETLGHGARTNRPITQSSFEVYEDLIQKEMREAIHSLLRQGQCRRIIPVVLASLGGGTGSAAAVLLLDIFMDPLKKSQIVIGLPSDLVARPVLFCVDPYSHMLTQTNDVAPDWILANAYSSRCELAEYEKAGKGYEYVFHVGLGNDSGAIFSTIEQACEINGQLCWEWMAGYSRFKARAVDGLDFTKNTSRYVGDDIPENDIPKEFHPPYAAAID